LAAEAIIFYLLSGVMITAGAAVIFSRNPVHSVLWLILAFVNAAGVFLLLGAELLAMLLVIVYVGAVAVLFLFVVMMLDIDFASLCAGFARYLPFGLLLGVVLATELAIVAGAWEFAAGAEAARAAPVADAHGLTNTQALGKLLYGDYAFLVVAAGLVLLVAMIGAIVLTHRQRPGVRRQDAAAQAAVRSADAVRLTRPAIGQGVEL
jgi:NADH-quinone oxidoreductase subunit J